MPFSREVRSRYSIALWGQYSRLIISLPPEILGSGGRKTPQCFKGSVSSANVHKEFNLVPGPTLVATLAFFTEIYLASLLLSITDNEESAIAPKAADSANDFKPRERAARSVERPRNTCTLTSVLRNEFCNPLLHGYGRTLMDRLGTFRNVSFHRCDGFVSLISKERTNAFSANQR
jgi:hypothetical protein